jgi:hypothetical protein
VRRRLRFVILALVALALSACQLQVEVGVDAHEDGSGTVSVGVGLDADAVQKLGGVDDLRQLVKVDDLTATGWHVTGPATERDGNTWIRATKAFSTPEQAATILTEVAGGPFKDFHLTRKRSFARTSFTFGGTVDFTQGLASFSDPDLTAALDGQPLGDDPASIEKKFGGAIDRLVHIRIAVRLPGSVASNAPGQASNGAVWTPKLADTAPAVLKASSRSWHKATLALLAVAALAIFALLLFVLVVIADKVRHRGAKASP